MNFEIEMIRTIRKQSYVLYTIILKPSKTLK